MNANDEDKLKNEIYNNLSLMDTEDLVKIMKTNNHEEWSDTAFEVVQEILDERQVSLNEFETVDRILVEREDGRPWYRIWPDVFLHPGVETYRRLLREPDHGLWRGYKWVACAVLVIALVNWPVIKSAAGPIPDISSISIYLLCYTLISPVLAVASLTFQAVIVHLIAKIFGGKGTWQKLVFCFSAIEGSLVIPGLVLSIVLGFVIAVDEIVQGNGAWVNVFLLVVFPFIAYPLALYILAIIAVESAPQEQYGPAGI